MKALLQPPSSPRRILFLFLTLLTTALLGLPRLLAEAGPPQGPPPPADSYLPLVMKNVQPVVFTHGVASGLLDSPAAVLWTRVNQASSLTLEVDSDPAFPAPASFSGLGATADTGYVVTHTVGTLSTGTQYYYRWSAGGVTSPVGQFQTFPAPASQANLLFAYSGDSDGTLLSGQPAWNSFEALDAALQEGLDFFLYLGDTIYADSFVRPGPPDVSLEEYRQTYLVNRDYAALQDLLAAVSIYAAWDDHEVYNDFAGETVDPARFANGRQAFRELLAFQGGGLPEDPGCAARPMFRVLHWGQDVDLIVLDTRSCRSHPASPACTFLSILDPAPTAPADFRVQFGLPPSPPPGCLEAINDPARTMLGAVQLQLLKDALSNSTATFKFVVTSVPIQQFYVFPYDRWEGYGAERAEILNHIRDNGIENVIFLTTDLHANLISHVFIDKTTDPGTIAQEFITGPIATRTMEQAIREQLGQPGVDFIQSSLTDLGVVCRHLDAYAYGLVDVDATAGTATILLKDDSGAILEDQVNPGTFCSLTIGP